MEFIESLRALLTRRLVRAMPELTFSDIDCIRQDVIRQEICYSHLADELIDHLCCDVENEMAGGLSFRDAYRKVKESLGHLGNRRYRKKLFML